MNESAAIAWECLQNEIKNISRLERVKCALGFPSRSSNSYDQYKYNKPIIFESGKEVFINKKCGLQTQLFHLNFQRFIYFK